MCGPYPARRADLCSLYDHCMQCGPGFFRPVSLPGDEPARRLLQAVHTICQAAGSCCASLRGRNRVDSQKNPLKPRRFGPGRIVAQFRAKCLDFSGASQPPAARAGSGLPSPKPGSASRHRWLLSRSIIAQALLCHTGAERSGCRSGAHVARMPGAAGKNLWEHTRGADGILRFHGARCIGRVIGLAVRMT